MRPLFLLMNSGSSTNTTHFSLFGLSEYFEVDDDVLNAACRTMQSQAHPDRYAHAGDAGRRVVMQWATRTNGTYRALRDPPKQTTYLLHLRGTNVRTENNTAMLPASLVQQMERRGALGDAKARHSVDTLDDLPGILRKEKRARCQALSGLLDSDSNATAAADTVRQLMLIEKIERDTVEAIGRLDD